jgi:hypothetical protein
MKTKNLILIAMLSACGMMSLSAQVVVDANGRAHIGAQATSPSQGCSSPFLFLGSKTGSVSGQTAPYGFIRNGEILYLAASRYDFCPIDHKTVFSTNYSGKCGIGKAPDANFILDIPSTIRVGSTPYTSDERLKRNIQPITSEFTAKLYDLKAQSYEKLEIRTELVEDKEGNLTEQVVLREPERKYIEYGFMAQDLKKLFPDLVSEGADGYLAINYVSLIPVMVEALKDQKARIEELESKAGINQLRSATSEETATGINAIAATACRLYQNAPNPFNGETEIRYALPETVQNAYICIFDMQGKMLKKINALAGENTLKIKGAELHAGMYLYSLIADGKEVDTKKMILTK